MKALVCEKCGAPLESSRCKYCGTRYLLGDNNGMAELERQLNNAKMEAAVNSQTQAVISVAYDGSQSLASYYNQLMGNGYCSSISNQLMALDTRANFKRFGGM
jgi:hypothetical protein